MTRMVEEQRVQIGALKALGYSRLSISRKYIGYGLLPSLVGGVLGLVIGYILFPKMIFTAYQIMYQMPDIELHAYTDISLFSVLAAVACTTVATLWACLATLRETPASLMRPRTPKAGKRVFLEYIKPLWRRMSFIPQGHGAQPLPLSEALLDDGHRHRRLHGAHHRGLWHALIASFHDVAPV